jgi:VanZ family protein
MKPSLLSASAAVWQCVNLPPTQMIGEPKVKSRRRITRNHSVGIRNRIWRYGPLLIWATLIFIGSSDLLSASHTSAFLVRPLRWLFPHASEATLELLHFVIRKLGHFTEYAILALFAAHAFRSSSRELLRERWFWISLLLVIIYSLSDEFHQTFVPSRTASIYDSMIDSVGGLLMLLLISWRWRNRLDKSQVALANPSHF